MNEQQVRKMFEAKDIAKQNERLRAENERLRERLDKIAKHPDTTELIRQYAQGHIKRAEGGG